MKKKKKREKKLPTEKTQALSIDQILDSDSEKEQYNKMWFYIEFKCFSQGGGGAQKSTLCKLMIMMGTMDGPLLTALLLSVYIFIITHLYHFAHPSYLHKKHHYHINFHTIINVVDNIRLLLLLLQLLVLLLSTVYYTFIAFT